MEQKMSKLDEFQEQVLPHIIGCTILDGCQISEGIHLRVKTSTGIIKDVDKYNEYYELCDKLCSYSLFWMSYYDKLKIREFLSDRINNIENYPLFVIFL
jgi:hypothetical protein